jgi:hypothetical protein|tara:strand:- start:1030 stop:1329 length:300 start_codon:yes stop_codon:yes gene_type:complete
MSKWIMTKFNVFTIVMVFILTLNKVDTDNQVHLAQLSKTCMAVKSNLPMNHLQHPCNHLYAPNQTIWSWLSDDSQSAHLHFLDLVELIQVRVKLFNESV